ncbi:DUF2442 domain-containing protein [Amaricoccus sp.]|uniref:DUF2442 domain-containing protein n=1 Tax=Amaricoccus sp. TaxID=1872485 RepID=UPI003457C531
MGAEDDRGVLAHGDGIPDDGSRATGKAEVWAFRLRRCASTRRRCGSLSDGRVIGVPPAWFPRLLRADPAARAAVEISPLGLHREALDEDVSVTGLLAGRGDRGRVGGEAA